MSDNVSRVLAIAESPEEFVRTVEVEGNSMTLTLQDNTSVAFVPTIPSKTSDLTNDSGFQNSTQVATAIAAHHDSTKQDTLTAGSNVSISNGVISATDTTYTAGTNVTIVDGVISASGGGASYTAGTGIDITNNVISSNVPKLTFTLAQVVSQNPITVQFTAEQQALVEVEQNMCFEFDMTGLGMTKNYWVKSFNSMVGGNIVFENSNVDSIHRGTITYNNITKQAVYSAEVNVVKAGTNISVDSSTGAISAVDTTYTAGSGISINNNVISVSGGGSSVTADGTTIINNGGTISTALGGYKTVTTPSSTVKELANDYQATEDLGSGQYRAKFNTEVSQVTETSNYLISFTIKDSTLSTLATYTDVVLMPVGEYHQFTLKTANTYIDRFYFGFASNVDGAVFNSGYQSYYISAITIKTLPVYTYNKIEANYIPLAESLFINSNGNISSVAPFKVGYKSDDTAVYNNAIMGTISYGQVKNSSCSFITTENTQIIGSQAAYNYGVIHGRYHELGSDPANNWSALIGGDSHKVQRSGSGNLNYTSGIVCLGAQNTVKGNGSNTGESTLIAPFVAGMFNTVSGSAQVAMGKCSVEDLYNKTGFRFGNGASSESPNNAVTVDWAGNTYIDGDIYVNCTDYTTTSSGFTTANCGGTKLVPATVQTTAPTAAITDGGVHIVHLASEPATKYNGYIYMIDEA